MSTKRAIKIAREAKEATGESASVTQDVWVRSDGTVRNEFCIYLANKGRFFYGKTFEEVETKLRNYLWGKEKTDATDG